MKKLLTTLSLLGLATMSVSATTQAASTPATFQQADLIVSKTHISDIKRDAAQFVAENSAVFSKYLRSELTVSQLAIQMNDIARSGAVAENLVKQLDRFDNAMVAHKGIGQLESDILELRLADESMLPAVKHGEPLLFAFEPKGDEKTWTHIEAFDANGSIHLLPVHDLPEVPVIVVDINSSKSMAAGIKLMKAALVEAGVSSYAPKDSLQASTPVTILDKIRVNDDQEPWTLGKAEMYAIVNGIDPSRDEPELDIVGMPYLDHEDTTYYPGQIMIYWDRYRYQAADMIIFEQDDNTNYQDIISGVLDIATAALTQFGQPTFAAIAAITNQIIQLMPGSWFTNDDDYIDVFYTLRKGYTYTNKYGASANAKADFTPTSIASN
jgi:hypothetical protein